MILYWLGFATPFVASGVFVGLYFTFGPRSVGKHCDYCEKAGLSSLDTYLGDRHPAVYFWINDARHRLRARLNRRHRRAWQDHMDRLGDGAIRRRMAKTQHKYGIPQPKTGTAA